MQENGTFARTQCLLYLSIYFLKVSCLMPHWVIHRHVGVFTGCLFWFLNFFFSFDGVFCCFCLGVLFFGELLRFLFLFLFYTSLSYAKRSKQVESQEQICFRYSCHSNILTIKSSQLFGKASAFPVSKKCLTQSRNKTTQTNPINSTSFAYWNEISTSDFGVKRGLHIAVLHMSWLLDFT